ncbi:GNAT family N-acetyltransferase [Metabacillus sp. 113a]|uniref:GNAT family N-acetyltransferase n=1 Tax=Metabacillus sp. 113a TaxID=3404706 RepID=UPI003CF221EC
MYKKEFYVFDDQGPKPAVIRNYHESDFDGLIRIQRESFPPPFPSELLWSKEQLQSHIRLFQEGALCIEVDGVLAGSLTSLLVDYDEKGPDHTWDDMTDRGYIGSHVSEGRTLYVVDIGVRPQYRKAGLGSWLMFSAYELVVHKKLDRLLGGGRMPGYYKKSDELKPEEYLEGVVNGELKDPVLTFLLRCGRTPLKVMGNYLEDEESCHYAALMEWKNPFAGK